MPPPPQDLRRSSFFAEAANLSMDRVDPDTLAAMPPDVRAELMHGTRARGGGGGSSGPNQPSLRRFMSRAGGGLADAVVRGTTGESTDGGDGAGRGATKRGWDAFGSILGDAQGRRRRAGGKRARPADETVGHDSGISGAARAPLETPARTYRSRTRRSTNRSWRPSVRKSAPGSGRTTNP